MCGIGPEKEELEQYVKEPVSYTHLDVYKRQTYLSQMNLFGHTKRATVYGSNINSAHNGVLAYAHMYGVYIIVPYIMTVSYTHLAVNTKSLCERIFSGIYKNFVW